MVAWRFTVALKRYETKNRGAGGFNELSASCNKSCNFSGLSYSATHQGERVTVGEEGSDKEVGRITGKTIKSTMAMKR